MLPPASISEKMKSCQTNTLHRYFTRSSAKSTIALLRDDSSDSNYRKNSSLKARGTKRGLTVNQKTNTGRTTRSQKRKASALENELPPLSNASNFNKKFRSENDDTDSHVSTVTIDQAAIASGSNSVSSSFSSICTNPSSIHSEICNVHTSSSLYMHLDCDENDIHILDNLKMATEAINVLPFKGIGIDLGSSTLKDVRCEEQLEDEISEGSLSLSVTNNTPKNRNGISPFFPNGILPRENYSDFKFGPCGIYEDDIFLNLREKEASRKSSYGYIGTEQTNIKANHRSVMVNWLVEFTEEFRLQNDSLFLAVAILDKFLKLGPMVEKNELQLIGMACMLIAVKFEETVPPNLLKECCIVAEKAFTQAQVIEMEALVLSTIGFECAMPTAYTFIWKYLKVVNADKKLECLTELLACLTLVNYEFLKFQPSLISASAVLLASHILQRDPWGDSLQKCSGYSHPDLVNCIKELDLLHRLFCERPVARGNVLSAIRYRYEKSRNLAVSWILPREELPSILYIT